MAADSERRNPFGPMRSLDGWSDILVVTSWYYRHEIFVDGGSTGWEIDISLPSMLSYAHIYTVNVLFRRRLSHYTIALQLLLLTEIVQLHTTRPIECNSKIKHLGSWRGDLVAMTWQHVP